MKRDDASRIDELEWATTRLAQAIAAGATLAPAGTRWPGFELSNDHEVYALTKFEGRQLAAGGPDVDQARAALVCTLIHEVTGEDCHPCRDCGAPQGGDVGWRCGECLAATFHAVWP